MTDWLPRLVARVPAAVHTKLLVAFLAIVVLLITVGAVSLQVLSDSNRRAEELVALHRKIAAYRQIQHNTTSQLYSVASALLVPDAQTLEATLRQLNQFGHDLDRLQFEVQKWLGHADISTTEFRYDPDRLEKLLINPPWPPFDKGGMPQKPPLKKGAARSAGGFAPCSGSGMEFFNNL
ncbi:MAG: hypothetical protein AB1671_05345 [Thermodesulfobacteriota bacterium]|jgi:hypothetical protein